jgi:hypothetical protein
MQSQVQLQVSRLYRHPVQAQMLHVSRLSPRAGTDAAGEQVVQTPRAGTDAAGEQAVQTPRAVTDAAGEQAVQTPRAGTDAAGRAEQPVTTRTLGQALVIPLPAAATSRLPLLHHDKRQASAAAHACNAGVAVKRRTPARQRYRLQVIQTAGRADCRSYRLQVIQAAGLQTAGRTDCRSTDCRSTDCRSCRLQVIQTTGRTDCTSADCRSYRLQAVQTAGHIDCRSYMLQVYRLQVVQTAGLETAGHTDCRSNRLQLLRKHPLPVCKAEQV